MMVPVKEDERLLAKDNEHSVDELRNLGPDKEQGSESYRTTAIVRVDMFTDSLFKGIVGNTIQQVWNSTNGTISREDRKEQVPESQWPLQVKSLAIGHHLLAEVAEDQIEHN